MHIPDGFLTSEIALALDAGAALALGGAVAALRREAAADERAGARSPLRERLAAAPAVGALVFAAQMLNVHVAGGTSGHLVGAVLACMLLGAPLGFLTTAVVLAVQALAFADGGLLALGANVLVMGGLGALAAALAERLLPLPRPLAAGLAAAVALLAGAVAVGALLQLSGTEPGAIGAMAETHVPIALIEAGATALVVAAAAFPLGARARRAACAALLLAAVALAPFASAHPDGLERVALDLGFAAQASAGAAFALAPDYAVPGLSGAAAETVGAALLGIALVGALAALLAAALRPRARARPA